jgi:magnesium chelatase subunit D
VVRRRLAYEADPAGFAAAWAEADHEVGERIASARAALGSVLLPDDELERIARVCAAFEVDGMRADLVTARAAIALAAWRGLPAVTAAEVRDAARLALPHRRRRNPFDAPGLDQDKLDEALQDPEEPDEPEGQTHQEPESGDEPDPGPDDGGGGPGGGSDAPSPPDEPSINRPTKEEWEQVQGQAQEQAAEESGSTAVDGSEDAGSAKTNPAQSVREQAAVAASEPYRTKLYAVPGVGEGVPGRRSAGRSMGRGRTVGAEAPRRTASSLHVPATVRAAAAHQAERGRVTGRLLLQPSDLRAPIRRDREGNLVLFVVDASGSMAARTRMAAVKGAVLSLLLDAYQRRDKVGLITFRGTGAEIALPPTSSVEAAAARLSALPTGGRTPLAAGLLAAADVVRRERLRDPRRRPLLVIVTDGRATSAGVTAASGGVAGADAAGRKRGSAARGAQVEVRRIAAHLAGSGIASIVVDCEAGPVRLGLAAELAVALGGEHVPMSELAASAHPRSSSSSAPPSSSSPPADTSSQALAAAVRATLEPLRKAA